MLLNVWRAIKEAIGHVINPRRHTDRQSEIINLVAAPIFVYTITMVVYYGVFHIAPYCYGDVTISDDSGVVTITEIGAETWPLFLTRCVAVFVYFQMMANWMNIRFVNNAPDRKLAVVSMIDSDHNSNLSAVLVNSRSHTTKDYRKNKSLIPGPVSAPPPVQKRSYWTWTVCNKCDLNAPPRCHHCPMCGICILKRDHHCFFTGRCVGFYNQRHFIIFLIWASFGTSYATVHYIPFLFNVLLPRNSYADIFPPFALLRWMFGSGSFQTTNYMFAFLLNAFFVALSTFFLIEQSNLINKGITQFESVKLNKQKLTITDPRPFADKVRAVMGYNYGFSIVFPLAHWFIDPHENPYEWPEHKIYKH